MLSGMREMKYEESYWNLIQKRFAYSRFTNEERDKFMYDNECLMIVRKNKHKH